MDADGQQATGPGREHADAALEWPSAGRRRRTESLAPSLGRISLYAIAEQGSAGRGPSDCNRTSPFTFPEDSVLKPYNRPSVWVPVGQTVGGDNARSILFYGGLRVSRWLQREPGLAPIRELVAAPSSSGS